MVPDCQGVAAGQDGSSCGYGEPTVHQRANRRISRRDEIVQLGSSRGVVGRSAANFPCLNRTLLIPNLLAMAISSQMRSPMTKISLGLQPACAWIFLKRKMLLRGTTQIWLKYGTRPRLAIRSVRPISRRLTNTKGIWRRFRTARTRLASGTRRSTSGL